MLTKKKYLLVLLSIALFVIKLTGQDISKKTINEYVWDLSYIFPNNKAWETEFKNVENSIKTIALYKNTMGQSAKQLANAMDAFYEIRSKAAKLEIYGSLSSDVDIKDENAAQMAFAGLVIERKVEAALSFIIPEITKIGKAKLQQWIQTEPRLVRHQRRINRIIQEAPHASSPEIEAILADMKGWPQTSGDGYYRFFESGFKWPVIKTADGKEIEVSFNNYRNIRRSANADDRINISKTYLGAVDAYKPILGYMLSKRIEADITIAKYKKFDDAIDAMWFLRDGAPAGTYKTIIQTAHKNKDLLKKYAQTLAKSYNISKVGYQDFYSLPKSYNKTYTIQEAWNIILKALAPLGKEFVEKAKLELQKPTMHLVPLPEKRNFYANQMPIGGIPSYSMLTYNGAYGTMGSLMGMLAQKVRFAEMPKENCPDTRDDPPVYGNGTLYIAEMMLADYMIKNAGSKEEKLFYIQQSLTRLWANCFSQVISAELESNIQQAILRNEAPSGAKISAMYYDILKDFYGDIPIDSFFANEWITNSVPFISFEAQFWLGSMGFACIAYAKIQTGVPGANKVMTESLMGKGKTDLSYDMLHTIGIDLSKAATYQAMYDRMNYLLIEMSKLSD
jgi:oligoendopeptidase F